ncbi:MAG: hypothetical protein ACRCXC_06115 [Legionella sp.]
MPADENNDLGNMMHQSKKKKQNDATGDAQTASLAGRVNQSPGQPPI